MILNPTHADLSRYDMTKAFTHEIIHMLDDEYGISYSQLRFIDQKIQEAESLILRNADEYRARLRGVEGENISISDIFSNVTKNKIYGSYFHSTEYWSIAGKSEYELTAGLLTEYITGDKAGLAAIKEIAPLNEILERLVKEFESI